MRPLDLSHRSSGWLVYGPVVIENDQAAAVTNGITYPEDGGVGLTTPAFGGYITLADPEGSVDVAPDATTVTLKGADGDYTVRRIQDDDGVWASSKRAVVPSESLDDLYGGTMSDGTPEALWAALDPDTEEFKELIYSSPTGVYARSNGNWYRYPEDDTSLDGLESIDVEPAFVQAFDKSETRGGTPARADVLKYAVEEPETEVEATTEIESAESGG
jgi:hypothetical protein